MDGSFTIYVLGDVELFRSALVAVSMIFAPSGGLFGGSGGLGLGPLAGLALLVSLTVLLLQGVIRQELELGECLIVIQLYSPRGAK